jgi:hypothetical protein
MAHLPGYICKSLFGAQQISADDILYLELNGQHGLIFSEASREALLARWHDEFKGSLRIIELREPVQEWKYRDVTVDNVRVAQLAQVPGLDAGAPPTSIEKMLIDAWVICPDVCPTESSTRISNKLLLLIDSRELLRENTLEFLIACFNGALPEERNQFRLEQVGDISLSRENLERSVTGHRIIIQAILERTTKARFLGLYRLHENKYLESIFARLQEEFLREPGGALEKAQKALSAERMQLIGLIEEAKLEMFFESVMIEVDAHIQSNNRYAHAIKRDLQDKNELKESWKRGAAWIYQTRCSIVHSGSGSAIYENFSDADEFVRSLIVPLEQSAISILGIRIVD